MAQTAMHEMIEWATSLKNKQQQCIDWIAIKIKAEELLVLEKQQMHKCASFWRCKENEIEKPMFDLYYKETYNK
jgi:hypothetical protein